MTPITTTAITMLSEAYIGVKRQIRLIKGFQNVFFRIAYAKGQGRAAPLCVSQMYANIFNVLNAA